MDKKIERIIELSDCKWIRDRWEPKVGDFCTIPDACFDYFREVIIVTYVEGDALLFNVPDENMVNKKGVIYLPVGFNTETGNYQIDDLLMEKLECNKDQTWYLIAKFNNWLKNKVYDKTWTIIILKLMWLRELIKEE